MSRHLPARQTKFILNSQRPNFVLVSYNRRDFAKLHWQIVAEGGTHAGILLLFQQRRSIRQELAGLREFIRRRTAEDMVNQLCYITEYIDPE